MADPSSASFAEPDAEALVTLARFSDEVSVHLAASVLEEAGVRVVVADPPQVGQLLMAELKVMSADVARAIEILQGTPARANLVLPRSAE